MKRYTSFLNNQSLRLIFFGGKGGAGKTTIACAAGVYLAGNRPDKRVLIISVDPSHSLSDSFGVEIGDEVTEVGGRRSEVGGQKTEVGCRMSDVRCQMSEGQQSTINNQQSTIFLLVSWM